MCFCGCVDLQDRDGDNGIPNGGYLHLGEPPSGYDDDNTGYNPLVNSVAANGHVEEVPQLTETLQANRPRSQGTVVTVNCIQMTVFGNIQGLDLLNLGNGNGPEIDVDPVDPEEEEEEERQRIASERAILEANEADLARRSAPLPPEQCQTIRNAMRGITLGFQPEWAGAVPEQEWMHRVLQNEGVGRRATSGGSSEES